MTTVIKYLSCQKYRSINKIVFLDKKKIDNFSKKKTTRLVNIFF